MHLCSLFNNVKFSDCQWPVYFMKICSPITTNILPVQLFVVYSLVSETVLLAQLTMSTQ